jgi:hypothetical protein
MIGKIGLYCIVEDTGLGFPFYLWNLSTWELLLGLLGWREKRGFVSPLSESPLGKPLVSGSDQDRELFMGLSFLPMIPSSRTSIGSKVTGSSS